MPLNQTERDLLAGCAGNLRITSGSRWRQLYELAAAHEVLPMVAWNVRQARESKSPPDVQELAADSNRVVAASVIRQGLESIEIAAIFRALNDLPVMLLKGHTVARRWYPAGARLSRDIDIYVEPSHYARARTVLEGIGYRIGPSLNEHIQLLQGKDVGFWRTDDAGASWSVELHVRLTEPGAPQLFPDEIWNRTTSLEFDGLSVRVQCAEDTLLLLALNLRKHRFARLKTVVDLSRLMSAESASLDWNRAVADAERSGFRGLLRHSVWLTRLMFPAMVGSESTGLVDIAKPPRDRRVGHRRYMPRPTLLLPKVATVDTVFGELRTNDASKTVSGLIPFVSLDKWTASLHLIYERLAFPPERANYYRDQGEPSARGIYRSRLQYWLEISGQLVRAIASLAQPKKSGPTSTEPTVGQMRKPPGQSHVKDSSPNAA